MGSGHGSRQNWESLRVFAACARHLSFTRAAAELGLTQAAVSQRVKQLEARLRTPLFSRHPRLALTPAGLRLQPSISNAFVLIERALAEVEGSRCLTLTTTLTVASAWLLPRLAAFRRSHPDIVVSLDVTDDLRSLADACFDVAIRTGAGHWPGIESTVLFPIQLTPMLSPRLLKLGGAVTLETIARLPWLPDAAWPAWCRVAGVKLPTKVTRAGVSVTSQQLAAEAALAGEAVVLLSPRFFQAQIAAGRLVRPFRQVVTDGSYYAAYRTDRRDEYPISVFREWLVREVTRDTPDS